MRTTVTVGLSSKAAHKFGCSLLNGNVFVAYVNGLFGIILTKLDRLAALS